MPGTLYSKRIDKDVRLRSYYGKFIFNSHFLIFLTIAAGVFLYTLLGFLQDIEPNVWLDIIASLLISISVFPKFRSLLVQADQIFLPPYEDHMHDYFKRMAAYSLTLGAAQTFIATLIAVILLSVSQDIGTVALIVVYTFIAYVMTLGIRRSAVNSEVPQSGLVISLTIVNFTALMLITVSPFLIIAGVLFMLAVRRYVNHRSFKVIDWAKLVSYEEEQLSKYYRNVSMFTNVKHIDKQFKRRKFLDPLLWQPGREKYNKENMYEFLFYRSFFRDNDLPMIILRLIILLAIVMIWLNQLLLSVIITLFGIYLIILQMSQIYTAQAYLLWPKIWPVKREYIQASYIKYSHKVVFAITLIFSILFVFVHPGYFYLILAFPVWGYVINHIFSKSVYKKERLLSD